MVKKFIVLKMLKYEIM